MTPANLRKDVSALIPLLASFEKLEDNAITLLKGMFTCPLSALISLSANFVPSFI